MKEILLTEKRDGIPCMIEKLDGLTERTNFKKLLLKSNSELWREGH